MKKAIVTTFVLLLGVGLEADTVGASKTSEMERTSSVEEMYYDTDESEASAQESTEVAPEVKKSWLQRQKEKRKAKKEAKEAAAIEKSLEGLKKVGQSFLDRRNKQN